ncbi:hypothetical protein [Stenotrophomonas maltophilia]|uniref:hypothetical protein n=1 Tax=Stenotrophomonas maltophilia TaxID=40324 RepID=UPI00128E8CEC|nr:hypothetical protein [Stenotrophomonas maltophilia]
MDASYIGWIALGISFSSGAVFYYLVRRWMKGILTVEAENNPKIERGFDIDGFLDLVCTRLDENAPGLVGVVINPLASQFWSSRPPTIRSAFFSLLYGELKEKLEGGAKVNPHDAATLLQMHNRARYFTNGAGDIPQWETDQRWPTLEEQCDHLIEVARRRQQKKLLDFVSEVQVETPEPVKRKM